MVTYSRGKGCPLLRGFKIMLTKSDLFKMAHNVTRETCYKYGCDYRVTFGITLKELMRACDPKNALKVWRFLARKDKPLGTDVKPIVNDLLKLFRTALNDPLFKKKLWSILFKGL